MNSLKVRTGDRRRYTILFGDPSLEDALHPTAAAAAAAGTIEATSAVY